MSLQWVRVTAATLLIGGCTSDSAPRDTSAASATTDRVTSSVQLIDSTIPPAIAGTDGWNYHLSAEADLDGDGQPERVVLTARVELYRSRPAWDDGQPWQVYVESADSTRQYIYSQRLQLGTLSMRVGVSEGGQPASIVLLEQLPHQIGVYESVYLGPDSITTTARFRRELDPRGQSASPMLP
ncbi:MAG: hypothetical protein ACR2HZ_12305 [Gemmatimonadaceae bacterium]